MSRGKLDKETSKSVDDNLPSVHDVRLATLNFHPEFISIGFPPESKMPIVAVCLQDATSSLEEVRYALLEALAHIIWYREKITPSNETLAVFFGKFYADDAALRMFAVKEHLTNAVANILNLNEQDLRDLRKVFKKVDDLTRIGKDLKNKSPNHALVNPIFSLIDSESWIKTKRYRNDWVHNKPPIIKGLGINYERKNRLIITSNTMGVTFGQGDEAKFSIDELLVFVQFAFIILVESTTKIVNYFTDYLEKNQKTEF